MSDQPGVKQLVDDLQFLSRAGGRGAVEPDEVAKVPAVQSMAKMWRGGEGDTTTGALVSQFLRAFIEEFGSTVPPASGGPRAMTEGNMVVAVGRMLRIGEEVPLAITHRRKAAVAGLNVSVAIFRTDPAHNKFDKYVVRFAELAIQFADRAAKNRISATAASATPRKPADTRIERLSRNLIEEIGSQHFLGIESTGTGNLYVTRDIEEQLLADLLSAERDPRVLIGEAGYGKTSLLWSLCGKLKNHKRRPLLISAIWLQRGPDGARVTSADEIVAVVAEFPEEAVLLLDTADLLLHSKSARDEVIELIQRLSEMEIPTIISTRPLEARSLSSGFGRRVHLESYKTESELPDAILALSGVFCPAAHPPGSDALAAIMSARARGLIVDEVCRSPLFLRVLFELSGPDFPQLEIDVTGLYDLFWERRIAADIRHFDGVNSTAPEDDLSEVAGLIGIAMLALGSPEPNHLDVLRRAVEVSRGVQIPREEKGLTRVLDMLAKRGVVVIKDQLAVSERSVRYFHQTFFEYAAARGLCHRAGEREVPRLVGRLLELPDDLFVGAVVEQVLIMLATDEIARPAVKAALSDLIRSGEQNLIEIAMMLWAHHPGLVDTDAQLLSSLSAESLRRFVRRVSSVRSDAVAVSEHLAWIWARRPALRTDVVTAMLSIVGRSPQAATEFIRRANVFHCLAVEHAEFVRSNAEPRVLLAAVLREDPALGRAVILDVISEITVGERQRRSKRNQKNKLEKERQGKEAVAQYLRLAAEHWSVLGTNSFLADLEELTGRIQDVSGDSDSQIVRDALAGVIAAKWTVRRSASWAGEWTTWVTELCRGLGSQLATDDGRLRDGDQSPILGARLIGVGLVLTTLTEPADADVVDATVGILFGLDGPSAPRQLARGCLVQVLVRDCPARRVVTAALADCLDGHLPAEHQIFVPGTELWAASARMVLMDSRIPTEIVAEAMAPAIRTYASSDCIWTSPDWLVALAASAIAANDASALAAIRSLTSGPIDSSDRAQAINIFLDHARDRAAECPEILVPLALALARRVNRTGTVKDLMLNPANLEELRRQQGVLLEWVGSLLAGTDGEQADGADWLGRLTKARVLLPEFNTVLGWFKGVRDPSAKANLVKTASLLTIRTSSLPVASELFASIVTTTREPEPQVQGAEVDGKSQRPAVVDAARDALLEARAFLPDASPAQWDEAYVLMFAPRLSGSMRVEVGGAGNLSRFMALEVENGFVDDAITQLGEVVTACERLSASQAHEMVNRMRVAVGTIVHHAKPHHFESLADIAERAPTYLRNQIAWGLLNSEIPPHLERRLAAHLPRRPRISGLGTFPEILSIPDQTAAEVGEIMQRREALQQATQRAYKAIGESGTTPDAMARSLGISTPSYRRLNGKKSWRVPGFGVCKRLDDVGRDRGYDFGLVVALRALEAAETRKKDVESWSRRPQ